ARLVAQLHDRLRGARSADRITASGGLGNGVGLAAVAELRAPLLPRSEPGLVDELIGPARRRGRSARRGVEVGFHLGGREQILKARAGGVRGLLDRAGGPQA